MTEENLECFKKNLCCACKNLDNCQFLIIDNNHTMLFEEADITTLQDRLNNYDKFMNNERYIIQSIIKNKQKDDFDEEVEELDFHAIHPKTDVVIITKKQYDDMIKEGIKLEKEIEKLKEQIKELISFKTKIIKEE